MIKPNELNPKLIKLIDSDDFVAMKKNIANNIYNQTCANCENKVNPDTFVAIDKKEYFISALCNECQPYFFFEKEAI
tara:strand:+ start:623 stop:853 length:231 start_codon:yes stop_codon:yes gene_type:complete